MNKKDIKNEILDLWHKTFHISHDFLSLVLDNYYNEEFVEYQTIDGKMVSCLLGIPYTFGSGSNILKGVYICGLATDEKYRHKGLMTSLLKKINERVAEEYDFTFVVPVSQLNADYYRRRGYYNSFYKLEQRYTSVHDFYNDFNLSILDSDDRIKELKKNLFDTIEISILNSKETDTIERVIKFIENQERTPNPILNIYHSDKDIVTVIKENEFRGFPVFIAKDSEGNITGLAFTEKEDYKKIKITSLLVEEKISYYALLNYIKQSFPEHSMSVLITSQDIPNLVLTDEVFAAENPDGGDLESLFGLLDTQFDMTKLMEPRGMLKILRIEKILDFLAQTRSDSTFKLTFRNSKQEGLKKVYSIHNGVLKIELKERKDDNSILNLSYKEFFEILLRKKDPSHLIMEAFGIPRLVLDINLLPF